jgi:hypothetical protein
MKAPAGFGLRQIFLTMRHLLICLPLLLGMLPAHAQQAARLFRDSLATPYLRKSAQQNKAGFILLGSGAAVASVASVRMVQLYSGPYSIFANLDPETDRKLTFWTTVFGVGGAAMVSSVPMFLMAGHNARRARKAPLMGLLLGAQPLAPTALGPAPAVPAVGLQLTL